MMGSEGPAVQADSGIPNGVSAAHGTIFKGLRLTPDVQLYFDPALKPGAGPPQYLPSGPAFF
jgi:hypothetical protein